MSSRLICDRCDVTIDSKDDGSTLGIERQDMGGYEMSGRRIDLCDDCVKSFRDWLHKRTPDRPAAVDGTCCSCGYSGEDETPCSKQEDGHHCIHWYEGETSDSTKERE